MTKVLSRTLAFAAPPHHSARAMRLLLVASLLFALPALAEAPPPPESAEVHAKTGIQARAPVPSEAVLPPRDGPRDAALQKIEARLGCTCYENGQLQIDTAKSVRAAECPCPEAVRVRGDLERSLAPLTTADLADKQKVAEQLEGAMVPLRAEYERVWRTPPADYAWFMDNVRCVCEGCKPTVFFSKCQLGCTPGIIYKLRARIFLGLGFTRDELLDYYRDEVNAAKSAREQVTREWLLPRRQRDKGWLVPALAIAGALLVGFGAVRRWSRVPESPLPSPPMPLEPLTKAERARIRRALEDDDG